MSTYRDTKPANVELDRPAPWWKRALARMRAWWRVQQEHVVERGLPAIVEHAERMAIHPLEGDAYHPEPPLPVPGPGRERVG